MPPKRGAKNPAAGAAQPKKARTEKKAKGDVKTEHPATSRGKAAPKSQSRKDGSAASTAVTISSETPQSEISQSNSVWDKESSAFALVPLLRSRQATGFPRSLKGTIYIKVHELNFRYHYVLESSVLMRESPKLNRMLTEPYEEPCPELAIHMATKVNPVTAYIEIQQDVRTGHWFLARAPLSRRKVFDLTEDSEVEDAANTQKDVAPGQPRAVTSQQLTPPPENKIILFDGSKSEAPNSEIILSSPEKSQVVQASTTCISKIETVQAAASEITTTNATNTEAAPAQLETQHLQGTKLVETSEQKISAVPQIEPSQTAPEIESLPKKVDQHITETSALQSQQLHDEDTIMTTELDEAKQTSSPSTVNVQIRPELEQVDVRSTAEPMLKIEDQTQLQSLSGTAEKPISSLDAKHEGPQVLSPEVEMRDASAEITKRVPTTLAKDKQISETYDVKMPDADLPEANTQMVDKPLTEDTFIVDSAEIATKAPALAGDVAEISSKTIVQVEKPQEDVIDAVKTTDNTQHSGPLPASIESYDAEQASQPSHSPKKDIATSNGQDKAPLSTDAPPEVPSSLCNAEVAEQQAELATKEVLEVNGSEDNKDSQVNKVGLTDTISATTTSPNTSTVEVETDMASEDLQLSLANPEIAIQDPVLNKATLDPVHGLGELGLPEPETLREVQAPISRTPSLSVSDQSTTHINVPPGLKADWSARFRVEISENESPKEPGSISVVHFTPSSEPHGYLELSRVMPDESLVTVFLEVLSGRTTCLLAGAVMTIIATDESTDRLESTWKIWFPEETKAMAKSLQRDIEFFKGRYIEHSASPKSMTVVGNSEKHLSNEHKKSGRVNNGHMLSLEIKGSNNQITDLTTPVRMKRTARKTVQPPAGPAPPLEICEAFNNFFLLMHNKTPDFGAYGQSDIAEQIRRVVTLATEYECLYNMRSYLTCELFNCGRELYLEIQNDPPKWLMAGEQLRSTAIYKEAMIHMIGVYPNNPWKTSSAGLPDYVLSSIKVKAAELKALQEEVKCGLMFQDVGVEAGKAKSWQTETLVGKWRQWLIESLNAAESKSKAATVYRALAAGGDAYLPVADIYQQLWELRRNDEELNIVQLSRELNQLKAQAQHRVQRLVENNSMFDVRAANIDYFTCARIDDSEIHWEADVQRLLLEQRN